MELLSDKSRQISELHNGRGIQNLLDEVFAILGNPIAMFDTEYRLQAYTSVITDDLIWNELITYGTFSYKTQVLFMEEGFIDSVANAETVVLLTSDKLKYDRISGKVYDEDKIHVANLIIVACNKPFDNCDLKAFESVCDLFSKEIVKSELYKTYGKMYQETYIKKLIDGEIIEKALYAAHIAIIYNSFESNMNMRLVIADIGRSHSDGYSKLVYFRDLFRNTQSGFEYAIYSDYILIIISSDNSVFDAKRDLGKLYGLFDQNNIYSGISNSFDNMYQLRKYYLEAVHALNYGLKNNLDGRLFLYSEIKKQLLDA